MPQKFNLVSSVTLYKSEYRNDTDAFHRIRLGQPFIANLLGTYYMRRNWSVGMKLERHRRCALHALRRSQIVARGGLGSAWARLFRLQPIQRQTPQSLCAMRPSRG